jgi:hypothetical protein
MGGDGREMVRRTAKARLAGLLFVLALLIIGCASAASEPTAPVRLEGTVTRIAVPATAPGQPEPTTAPAGQATQTAGPPAESLPHPESPQVPAGALPPPTLFDLSWDDPAPFEAGLIAEEAAALELLAAATVYHLDLALSPDLHSVAARQELRYTNREELALDEIYLHLFPNLLGGWVRITDLAANGAPAPFRLLSSGALLALPLDRPLAPGEQIVVQMGFEVGVPAEPGSNYGVLAVVDEVLALAHFYPQVAVFDHQGWNIDPPPPNADPTHADAAFYLVRIHAPLEQTIVTSGVEITREESGDSQILTVAAGPARDFYIASSARYHVTSRQIGPVTLNSYGFPEFTQHNRQVLDVAAAALESLSRQIGPYAYTELDIVPTFNLAFGVEYPGVAVLNARLYDPDATINNNPTELHFESTIAHEIGHQWFYNVVGNDQLDEPWLDESLTQYVTYLYYLDVRGQAAAETFRRSFFSRWDRVNRDAIPIGLPAGEYGALTYGSIVYGRGPLFFEALSETMGDETFLAFLRDYYQRFKWEIATGRALKELAERHCACDLSLLFAEWVGEP